MSVQKNSNDWRAATLDHVRTLIQKSVPGVVEERKWIKPTNPAGVPVWSVPAAGKVNILCTGETYKTYVKLTFAQGAKLPDPTGLFNAGLDGGTRRAIDLREGDTLDAVAFKTLIRAAAAFYGATTDGGKTKLAGSAAIKAPSPKAARPSGKKSPAKGEKST